MKTVWLIEEGNYRRDGYPVITSSTKKIAETVCRKNGFKFNKEQDLFLNEKTHCWRKLTQIDYLTESN